jgi:hypothetical protein
VNDADLTEVFRGARMEAGMMGAGAALEVLVGLLDRFKSERPGVDPDLAAFSLNDVRRIVEACRAAIDAPTQDAAKAAMNATLRVLPGGES